MKKLLLIVVAAALALTLVPLALAGAPGGGGWKHGKAKFNLVGRVAEPGRHVDPHPDPHHQGQSRHEDRARAGGTDAPVTMYVAAEARIWLLTEDGAVAKTLADIAGRRQGQGARHDRQGR